MCINLLCNPIIYRQSLFRNFLTNFNQTYYNSNYECLIGNKYLKNNYNFSYNDGVINKFNG